MQWITVGEINAELCDVSLKKYLFHLLGIDEDKAFTLNEKEKVDIINSLHNKIINSPKYLQLRSSLILNQNDYLEYNHNAIFQRELQENLIELYCDYQMLLSHEGMCNIMYYIFYDVYCSKKQLKNIEGYAECKSFSGKQWSWHKNAIFKGLLEEGYFEVKADRFWSNFAKEVISKQCLKLKTTECLLLLKGLATLKSRGTWILALKMNRGMQMIMTEFFITVVIKPRIYTGIIIVKPFIQTTNYPSFSIGKKKKSN
jgi:hypothetical protein